MALFPQMGYQADPSDDTRIALLKTLEYLNDTFGIVASPFPEGTQALPTDDVRRAAIKINADIVAGQGGSTADVPEILPTPSGINDFSSLPNGVAPPAGGNLIYFAVRNAFTYWTIGSGDTQWTVIDKNNP
jgi:hypothetical protein